MRFSWPWMLLLLGLMPLLVLEYRSLLRGRRSRQQQLAALGLVADGGASTLKGTPSRGRRRHVAPAFFLLALVMLVLAMARPQASVAQPRWEGTVVLAFDVSGSMAATDVAPSRLESAKAAARAFVKRQPAAIRLGVVAFGGSGVVTQRPTIDRAVVLSAINRLTPQGDTGLGRGIQAALSAIVGKNVILDNDQGTVEATGPDLGFHRSAAVLLMTDGENTAEPDPVEVAQVASAAGVRVYTVGFGTAKGTVLDIDGFKVGTALDEPGLKKIATTTDAEYFSGAQPLTDVGSKLPLSFTVKGEYSDVTWLFCLAGGALLLIGATLSLAWSGRVI